MATWLGLAEVEVPDDARGTLAPVLRRALASGAEPAGSSAR